MFSSIEQIKIIQGGMGVFASSPSFVNDFSRVCERKNYEGLGTVSGTAADRLMVEILQSGDPGGHFKRALAHFPIKGVADKILARYYDPKGLGLKTAPVYRLNPSPVWIELAVTANFAFVWLAKEGHNRPVSINYLEKIALPFVYFITGAVMAGVDVVTMGAGLPFDIPQVLEDLVNRQTLHYPIPVIGSNGEKEKVDALFNPWEFFGTEMPDLKRPAFLPIISSFLLAKICMEKLPKGSVQGFVVEEATAGGHNASPRGPLVLDNLGQPVYGEKDSVDYKKLAKLGLPFWIGGSCASPERIYWAIREVGANGIQAGSIFAFSDESGLSPLIREDVRRRGFNGTLRVFTSPRYSPTGYPFKVAVLPDTLADQHTYNRQIRACTQGALVTLYRKPDGSIGYRCPSEPIDLYIKKGGKVEDTTNRRCICSGLIAATGMQTDRPNSNKKQAPIVTTGDDLDFLTHLMDNQDSHYGVEDALDYLCG